MQSIMDCTAWTEELSNEESLSLLINLALPHARRSGRFSHRLRRFLRRRDWAGLSNMELDYKYTDSVESLVNARQTLAFFAKYQDLPLGISKEEVAFEKFLAAEKLCGQTNELIRNIESGSALFTDPAVESVVYLAQRKISRVLGEVPSLEALKFSFGPGANTSVKSTLASARAKLHFPLACSSELLSMASAILSEAPAWAEAHADSETEESWIVPVEIHRGKLQFVPKNAKTYRSIVVEPSLNGFLQKGIGTYMKTCLKRAGLDLSDQSRNQHLACIGSMTGNLTTVDLSSASDTISREVVGHLLPYDWYSLLSSARTGAVEYKGRVIHLEKFSSMGNAFTFELESLIFWALACGVCDVLGLPKGWTTSYGDDIIIPTEGFELLKKVLETLGFVINVDKTFNKGPFRESCGKDYFLGTDIRPFYAKSALAPYRLFSLHNFYMRNLRFTEAKRVSKLIHPSLRLYGPDGYGDGHLIGDHPNRLSRKHRDRGWGGNLFDTFTLRLKTVSRRLHRGDRVLPVYSTYVSQSEWWEDSSPINHYAVRGPRFDKGRKYPSYKRISVYTLRQGIFY